MVVALILCIPITALVVGFLVLKATQLGLRWQVQVKQEQAPTMESINPIAPIVQAKQAKEHTAQVNELLDEWVNGPKER